MVFFVEELLFGRQLFHYLNQKPLSSLLLAVLVVFIGGMAASAANAEPLLLFYVGSSSSALGEVWFVLLFLLGWLATFLIADLLCVALFHRKGSEISLLTESAFAMLPLLLVPGFYMAGRLLSAGISLQADLILLLSVLAQVWVVCLLAGALSVSKGLRMERSALVSLGAMYLNNLMVIAALQLRFF